MLRTHLNQRQAFASLFTYRTTLAEMDPALVNGIPAAIDNAEALSAEVVEVIRAPSRPLASVPAAPAAFSRCVQSGTGQRKRPGW